MCYKYYRYGGEEILRLFLFQTIGFFRSPPVETGTAPAADGGRRIKDQEDAVVDNNEIRVKRGGGYTCRL